MNLAGQQPGQLEGGLLDPDWQTFSDVAQRASADISSHLAGLAGQPAWREMPQAARTRFAGGAPRAGEGLAAVYEQVWRDIIPYPHGTTHPRHWGWVNGSGLPVAALGDFLASAMNPNCTQHDCAPLYVELQTLDWLKEMLGFPSATSAVLLSGASAANLVGLAVARHDRCGADVRRLGIAAAGKCTFYATREAHSSVGRAIELLGFGSEAVRNVAVDELGRMVPQSLLSCIRADRASGCRPIAVVATAGTVNTGAIDGLADIAEICRAESVWLHVDGAFGALAWLDPRQREKLSGLQMADSLAFDAHKWLFQPYDIACVFVRDAEAHRSAFEVTPAYLSLSTPVSDGPAVLSDLTLELSRRFRALKLWMSIKAHGTDAFSTAVATNIDQAAYLGQLVEKEERLELASPVMLNVVCFRYSGTSGNEEADNLNLAILSELHRRGIAVPSATRIGGRVALRAAITNHRSGKDDFDALVHAVVEIGGRLTGGVPIRDRIRQ